jgi:hypothetical protein
VGETWRRFVANRRPLLTAGLLAALLHGGLDALIRLFAKTGPGLPPGVAAFLEPASITGLPAVARSLFLHADGGLLGWSAQLAVTPLATGGLFYTIIQVLNEEPASPAGFLRAGLQYWGRIFAIHLFSMLPSLILIGMIPAAFLMGSAPAPLIIGVFLLAAVCVMVLGVALTYYAPYMAIAEGLGAMAAVVRALRIVRYHFWDTVTTLGVIVAIGVLADVARSALGAVPVGGPWLSAGVDVAAAPFVALYCALRYECNIKPILTPPGGAGVFHPNPPTGL